MVVAKTRQPYCIGALINDRCLQIYKFFSTYVHNWFNVIVTNTFLTYVKLPRTVLTGAHCFRGRFRKANNTEVLLNAHRLDPMPNVHLTK